MGHACKHAHIPTHLPTYPPTHVHTYIHTYIHTCMHTYMHTYIHTYIHYPARTGLRLNAPVIVIDHLSGRLLVLLDTMPRHVVHTRS